MTVQDLMLDFDKDSANILTQFVTELGASGMTTITQQEYLYEICRGLAYMEVSVKKITVGMINWYIDEMGKKGYTVKRTEKRGRPPKPWIKRTQKRVLGIFKDFLEFLRRPYFYKNVSRGSVLKPSEENNPSNLVKIGKVGKPQFGHAATPRQRETMLDKEEKDTEERYYRYLRDRAIIYTFFYTGIRVSELVCFQYKHIRGETPFKGHRYLDVPPQGAKGKSKRGDTLQTIISEGAIAALDEYKDAMGISDDEVMFDMTEGGIRKRLYTLSKGKIKVRKGKNYLTPHDFRRGFACYAYYYVANKDILAVKRWLRHESLETVDRYIGKCKELVDQFIKDFKKVISPRTIKLRSLRMKVINKVMRSNIIPAYELRRKIGCTAAELNTILSNLEEHGIIYLTYVKPQRGKSKRIVHWTQQPRRV
jgi:integrase